MKKRLIAALLLGLAAMPALAEPPKPLLWKVSDADNSVYLLGSFHLLKPSDYPLAASTDAAFDDAEQVVFELSPADLESPVLVQTMLRAALRSDGRTLEQSMSPQAWAALTNHGARRGLDVMSWQKFDAWFVSLLVANREMELAGLDPEQGLDKHFAARTVAAGKATRGLETIDQQIGMFDGMTPEQQRQALEDTLEEVADFEATIGEMHRLWRAGDADGLNAITGAEMKREFPSLYNRMNRDRNRAWLPELRKLLDGSHSDDTLVIVGAMHLLGEDGVVEGLRKSGYTVERM